MKISEKRMMSSILTRRAPPVKISSRQKDNRYQPTDE